MAIITLNNNSLLDVTELPSGISGQNYPAFEAYLSTFQTITKNVNTKVQFDTETLDTDSCYDNSTNYRFTPTVTGKYYVYSSILCNAGTDHLESAILRISKNNSEVRKTEIFSTVNNIDRINLFNSIILDFNGSTDYVEVFIEIDDVSGSPRASEGVQSSYFGAYRIGD